MWLSICRTVSQKCCQDSEGGWGGAVSPYAPVATEELDAFTPALAHDPLIQSNTKHSQFPGASAFALELTAA